MGHFEHKRIAKWVAINCGENSLYCSIHERLIKAKITFNIGTLQVLKAS